MSTTILARRPLGFPWQTTDPFLFCVHHLDAYPSGDPEMAVNPSMLAGRNLGADFSGKDGWSMYHGDRVPGFPQHPHRGFETVTIVRQGFIDHTDSLGAAARFGAGDVQWLTAGSGVVHSEMFPLVHSDQPNTTELFQIWLNLPQKSKMVEPYFRMFWRDEIPRRVYESKGRTEVQIVAGALEGLEPLSAPPDSWASDPESDVAIWVITMEPGASWNLPAAREGTKRDLHFFAGDTLSIDGEVVEEFASLTVDSGRQLMLEAGKTRTEILLLQGRPLNEPVAQHGPFVMNYPGEIRQAMLDYQQTRFGGWPWPVDAPVHPKSQGRFARHPDGRREEVGW